MTNVTAAVAEAESDFHSDVFDLSTASAGTTPTTIVGFSISVDDGSSGSGDGNDIADDGSGRVGVVSADENTAAFGLYGGNDEQGQEQREEQRREGENIHADTDTDADTDNTPFQDSQQPPSEGRGDVTDTASTSSSSSSSSSSGPEDSDFYDRGDPLVNFSEDEMRSFALMGALARALLPSSGKQTTHTHTHTHTTHDTSSPPLSSYHSHVRPLVYLPFPSPPLPSPCRTDIRSTTHLRQQSINWRHHSLHLCLLP